MASVVSAGDTEESSRQRVSELKERILDAATRLFAERGWRGTHIGDVARDAGCTKPALYYHFESKDTLFLACVAREVERVGEVHRAAHREGTARQRLFAAIAAVVEYSELHPHGMRLMFRAWQQPEELQPVYDLDANRVKEISLMRQAIDHGIASGELRSDLDPVLATEMVTRVVEARLMRQVVGGSRMSDDEVSHVIETFYRGFA